MIILKVEIFSMQRGNQKLSKTTAGLTTLVILASLVCVFIAMPSRGWLWLISIFKYVFLYILLAFD